MELKSGLNSQRIGGPRPIDEKKLDFQAAFLEVGAGDDRNWIKLRAGRQEMEYGSGRLIDVREGPNVRLSFDGFKVTSGIGPWEIDGFAMRPDIDKPGFFDNAPNHSVGFWGLYASRGWASRKTSLDTYYLGLDRKEATFQRGTTRTDRLVRLDLSVARECARRCLFRSGIFAYSRREKRRTLRWKSPRGRGALAS